MQIVVLCGGLGTRLLPVTAQRPKSLVPVHGRPFIDYQLDLFRRRGATEVVLCTGHLGDQIREHVGDGSRYGLRVRYSEEGERQLGTAGAIRHAEPLVAELFFLTYGDSYLPIDYCAVLQHFLRHEALGTMVVYRNQNRHDRSNVVVNGEFVESYDKEHTLPGMDYINFGLSLLRKEALVRVPAEVPYTQEDWYQDLVAERRLLAYETTQRFYEVGSTAGLDEFAQLVAPTAGGQV